MWVVDIVTGHTVAWLKFDDGVQEIFAVELLPHCRLPDLLNDNHPVIADSFVLPDAALADVPAPLRFVAQACEPEVNQSQGGKPNLL